MVDGDLTGKLTKAYNDEHTERIVEDFNGYKELMKEESSIALYPCHFSLTLSEDYRELLANFAIRFRKGIIT
jgi:hypothetical protein